MSKVTETERRAGMLTIAALIAAFAMANSPLFELYWLVHHTPVSIRIGEFAIDRPLIVWINKGLMVFFFLLVGLEIKREVMEGELAGMKRFALPLLAALGGMAAPAAIYIALNATDSVAMRGWAIPTATDIVLALAVLSLLRNHIPEALVVFLVALAIFDDVGAILIIALFYSEGLSMSSLLVAAVGVAILFILNRYKIIYTVPYLLTGLLLWAAVVKSGVHATLVGILVAIAIPLRGVRNGGACSPLKEMESSLRPWVILGIVPVFAFFNAGVTLSGLAPGALWTPVASGIALGLFAGKQLGVFGATWLAVRAGIGRLPNGVNWAQMYGVALLAGIGFTMSLFVTSLAFDDKALLASARFAILIGSILSAIVGLIVLWRVSPRRGDREGEDG